MRTETEVREDISAADAKLSRLFDLRVVLERQINDGLEGRTDLHHELMRTLEAQKGVTVSELFGSTSGIRGSASVDSGSP